MTLEEMVTRAIPISNRDCNTQKMHKAKMRTELKQRIEDYVSARVLQIQVNADFVSRDIERVKSGDLINKQ